MHQIIHNKINRDYPKTSPPPTILAGKIATQKNRQSYQRANSGNKMTNKCFGHIEVIKL